MSDTTTARHECRVGELCVRVYDTAADLGAAAARYAAAILTEAVRRSRGANVMLATGNSQLPFVTALAGEQVPWSAVTAFHMDEYVGIGPDHPASFRRWITERIAQPFDVGAVELIGGDAADPVAECTRYADLLRAAPLDLVCMGIGENGHLAFNEPGDADFADPAWVRQVALTERSRKQQVDEGHFPDLAAVPECALTVTIPALLSAPHVQVVVPERRKAAAVSAALTAPVSTACPATILRTRQHAALFLDTDSAHLLELDAPTSKIDAHT